MSSAWAARSVVSSPPSPQSDDHFQAVALLGTGGQFAVQYGYQLSPMMEQRGSAQPGDRGSVRCFVNGGVRISEASRNPLVESEAQHANLLYPGPGCPRAAEPCLPLFPPGVADGVSHCRLRFDRLRARSRKARGRGSCTWSTADCKAWLPTSRLTGHVGPHRLNHRATK